MCLSSHKLHSATASVRVGGTQLSKYEIFPNITTFFFLIEALAAADRDNTPANAKYERK